jgi:Family of unknown function (DUF6505)
MTNPIKMLRTIRLDPSDGFVFDPSAQPGEWAVPGGFMFWDQEPAELVGRPKQAFRAGFLGLSSFGWSTLVVVVEATRDERAGAVEALAAYLLAHQGAPTVEDAQAAAEDEIAYAQSLAGHPVQTLIALHRSVRDDGSVSEQFRTLSSAKAREDSQMPCSAGAFAIVEDESAGDDNGDVDMMALAIAAQRTKDL